MPEKPDDAQRARFKALEETGDRPRYFIHGRTKRVAVMATARIGFNQGRTWSDGKYAAVKNIPDQNVFNRQTLDTRQRAILGVLRGTDSDLGPTGAWGQVGLGRLPTTGNVVRALGLEPTASAYASVSRSLRRLEARGMVQALQPSVARQGRGVFWRLSDVGASVLQEQIL